MKFLLTLTFLLAFTASKAQPVLTAPNVKSPLPPVKYTGDTFVRDTFIGTAMLTDSMIRMVQSGNAFRYEKVQTIIVVDAFLVKEYRFLVRASDGGTDPFDMNQSFHLLTGALIDPRRLMGFKQREK